MPKFMVGDRVILKDPAYPYKAGDELTISVFDCPEHRLNYAPQIVVKLTGRKGAAHTFESRLDLAAPLSPFEQLVHDYITSELSAP